MPEKAYSNECALEQAKKRDRKVYITDIAIDKVPDSQMSEMQLCGSWRKMCCLFQRKKMTVTRFPLPVILGQKTHSAFWCIVGNRA